MQETTMNPPIQHQPTLSHLRQQSTEVYVDAHHNSVALGPPVVLGPIVAMAEVPRQVGPQPTFMTCHICNHEIRTRILYRPTLKTHLLAACLCMFGCGPCVWMPYLMYTCNKTNHYCPYCSAFIGSYYAD